MPNFLENLRLKSLFGNMPMGNNLPSQGGITGTMYDPSNPLSLPKPRNPFEGIFNQPAPTMDTSMETASADTTPPMMGGGQDDIASRMKQLYTPETENSDKLNQLLAQYPERSKPGWLRKIAAGIVASRHGMAMGEKLAYGDFQDKLEDWKNKVGPTERAAQLERQTNVNERTAAYQIIAAELRQQAIDAKEKNDATNAKIRQQRADVYEYKARNPSLRLDVSGSTVKVFDPGTGTLEDTKIPTGSLSDADKLALQHEYRSSEIEQRGDITSRQIGERGDEARETAVVRGTEARKTKETPSGAGKGRDELPTQTRVRQFNAARELANTRPDLKKWIKIGNPGSNDFTITPPSKGGFFSAGGPTQEQYDKMSQAIYGMKQPDTAKSHGATPDKVVPETKTIKQYSPSRNQTRISTDGGKTWKVVAGKQ